MSEGKVYLHPGYIIANDGDRHFINSLSLAYLYGLEHNACVVIDEHRPSTKLGHRFCESDIHLYPSSSGDYYKVHIHDESK